jgi:single-stranded-DNA-specific exonuclease
VNLPRYKWDIGTRDPLAEGVLQRELGVSSLVAALLVRRGFAEPAAAQKFLRASLDDLHDPALLPDYRKAVDAIMGAKDRGETIFVHGDYDVDGVTSAAIFDRFLIKIGCKVKTHVPHRMKEGYGIHKSAVEAAIACGAKLFLTCDCGTSALEQIEQAKAAGMTVVVTDHHQIGEQLPRADAFINPHRADSVYPFKELSGAGVALKLCAGITSELGIDVGLFYRAYLDLACLGTVADVMPLIDENRIIAKHGLIALRDTKKPGLRALKEVAEIEPGRALNTHVIGFVLGPRLNATGRVDDSAISLQLLLEQDETEAKRIASIVDNLNRERKAEQERTIEEALALCAETGAAEKYIVIVCKEGWHPGIVGIVASRLVETYHRPAFVMCSDALSGMAKGSGRSIEAFPLASAIWAHPELVSGGGHAMAAGMSFQRDRFDEVVSAFDAYARTMMTEDDLIPVRKIDLAVLPGEVSMASMQDLAKMEPFGTGNAEPTMVAQTARLVALRPTRNPQHMQLTLTHGVGPAVDGIAFRIGEELAQYESGTYADVVFRPTVDSWQGRERLKWQVQEVRPTEAPAE